MTNVRGRIVFGALIAILGAAVFLVVAARVLDHSSSKILAAIAGGLAFPVAPVVWHVLGERRRTMRRAAMKAPPKTSLTGSDRYWMRFAATVLIVIGPLVALGRFDVVRAVWRHGLWFVPASEPADPALLKRVPADAELVVVFHQDRKDEPGEAVLAWGDGHVMAASDRIDAWKTAQLDDINLQLAHQPWLPIEAGGLGVVSTSETSVVMSSARWHGKVQSMSGGPSAAIGRELGRAPPAASIVVGFAPKTIRDSIRSGALWFTAAGDKFVVEGRVEARDDGAAAKLVTLAKAALHFETKDIPEGCRDPVSKIADQIHFTQDGAVVSVRAELPAPGMLALVMCAMK